jgi:hypothetical protein
MSGTSLPDAVRIGRNYSAVPLGSAESNVLDPLKPWGPES